VELQIYYNNEAVMDHRIIAQQLQQLWIMPVITRVASIQVLALSLALLPEQRLLSILTMAHT
jgi:hypothetical protein